MLARIRPGLLVVATLVAAPIAACSSDSDDHASVSTNTGTASTDSGAASGGAQGSGGSTGSGDAGGATSGSGGTVGDASSGGSDTSANGPSTTSAGTGGTTAGAGGSSGAAGTPGDLPYANVVAVAAVGVDGGYMFDVSVESADVDCSQFADWWELVSEDGTLLYRRILEHSHTDENGTSDADAPGNTFTRGGGPVYVSAEQVVIVRAHMNNLEEYNGAVMRGSVALGFETATDLDPNFAADLESAAPQPDACLF